jgi:hypothetical protein
MACLSRKSTTKSNVATAKVKKSGRRKSSATSSRKKRNSYTQSSMMKKNFYPVEQFPVKYGRSVKRRTIYDGSGSGQFPTESVHQNRTLVHSQTDGRIYERPKLFKPRLSLPVIAENPNYFRQIARSPTRQQMPGSIFDVANFNFYQQQRQHQMGVNRNPLRYQQYTPQNFEKIYGAASAHQHFNQQQQGRQHGTAHLFLNSGGSHHYVNERNFEPDANDLLFYGEQAAKAATAHSLAHLSQDRHRRKVKVSDEREVLFEVFFWEFCTVKILSVNLKPRL